MHADPIDPTSTWMYREAAEAADVVAVQFARNQGAIAVLAAQLRAAPPPFVVTCARGRSDHAASYARDLLESGDLPHAAGLAADVVALADSARLGRDAVEGRLILAWALSESGDHSQAAQTFRTALEQAAGMPMPLRVAQ